MSQVSNRILHKKTAERIYEIFICALVKVENNIEAKEFIGSLFTPTERIMLAKRLAIAYLLDRGLDYRSISRILRVSLPTIAYVSTVKRYEKDGFKSVLDKVMREEKIRKFMQSLISSTADILSKSKGGGYLKKYVRTGHTDNDAI